MEKEGWAIAAVIICAVILLIIALKKQSEWLMNIILRGILGTIGIYILNQVLIMQNLPCEVGINPYTVGISSILGFPGVILLYGIRFYYFL